MPRQIDSKSSERKSERDVKNRSSEVPVPPLQPPQQEASVLSKSGDDLDTAVIDDPMEFDPDPIPKDNPVSSIIVENVDPNYENALRTISKSQMDLAPKQIVI